ncbi:MAG: V-type ATP synthase subunit F [Candidatus Promineifilaceae bacterium]|nr:V-type ATP synthase subunit F [Candidatus Promineifilaceae bacterium]
MSRLLVVVRPSLVSGFHLAGVDAFAAEDAAAAQKLITSWFDQGESGLLAIDEAFLEHFAPSFRSRLDAAERLPYLALPTGEPSPVETSAQQRIAELVRQVVGFHITFEGEER